MSDPREKCATLAELSDPARQSGPRTARTGVQMKPQTRVYLTFPDREIPGPGDEIAVPDHELEPTRRMCLLGRYFMWEERN